MLVGGSDYLSVSRISKNERAILFSSLLPQYCHRGFFKCILAFSNYGFLCGGEKTGGSNISLIFL